MPIKETSDVFQIKNKDSDTKLRSSIESITKKEGYISHKVSIRKVPSNGVNCMGELTKAKIEGDTVDGRKETNIFIKTKLLEGNKIKVLSMNDVYCKELYAYKELSKIYNKLQDEANIPAEEKYEFVKCYDESDSECIILEDIVKKDFVTCNRYKVVTMDFAEKCVTELAKFHALSFVLEKKQENYFKETIKPMKYALRHNEEFKWFLKNMSDVCIRHLDGEYKIKLEKFVCNMADKFQCCMNDAEKVRCLCHGDFRAMNIMMNVTNGKVSKVIPIDYQLIFYGSPITDFIYFIFGCTDREFRKKYLINLKYLYFNTMTEFLERFSINIDDILSKDEFDKAFEESIDLSLMISVWYLPVNLAGDDEILDLNKVSLSDVTFGVNERVKSRLQDVIDDLTEWGRM